jgi:cardiolipin synthase A/B
MPDEPHRGDVGAEPEEPGASSVATSRSAPAPEVMLPEGATAFVRRAARYATPRPFLADAFEGPRPSFSRALWRIAAADVSSGNHVTLIRSGIETFDAMCEAIDSATTNVQFEGYIYRDDEVGRRFADALVRAAQRGVRVRLLIDWVGRWPTPLRFFRGLEKAGVSVRFFNPPGFRSWLGLLPRDHRKLLVVDDRVGFTGGMGIGREWTHGILRQKRSPWRDTVVRIEGEAAVFMHQAFGRMWARSLGRTKEWKQQRRAHLALRETHLNARYDPSALVGIIEGEPGRLRVSRALQLQALAAERSIYIASAYFAPSWSEAEALAGAARDGVDVRLLVPSQYDHPWLRGITTHFYARLISGGVRIWEWPGEMMHAKSSVVDGRWSRVGSTDFNPLGVVVNYELDAVIEDRTIGRQAEQMFLDDLDRSKEITNS